MSIDKWVSETKEERENREKINKIYKSLPEDKVLDLKKRKIQDLKKKGESNDLEKAEPNSFLNDVLEFKEWLNKRTYLKGDLNKIEMWIKNLNKKLNIYEAISSKKAMANEKSRLIEEYRKIPPNFLDEKIRIALNKKIHNMKRTNSDNYYLRKLKSLIQEKLKEASYYELLKKLIEL